MKKIIVALMLVMSLMVLCAGCGSSEAPASETAAVSATMAPVEEAAPEEAAQPEEEAVQTEEEPVSGEDAKELAMGMTGSPVEELFAAVGEPNSTEYTTSCLIPTGEDGLLYYDGFTVSTIKYPDGTELVMGAF